MKGDLTKIRIVDIVKALSMIGKSGRLHVSSSGSTGYIHLKRGSVTYAEEGNLYGEDALYSMALKSSGVFHYDPETPLVPQNVHLGMESLFIALSRQVDRYQYLLSRVPQLDDRLSTKVLKEPSQYDPEIRTVLRFLTRPLALRDLLNRVPYSRIKTLEIVMQLMTKNVIGVNGKTTTIPKEDERHDASLEASLKVISIGEVVQILVLIGLNGRLSASWDDRKGEVYIEQGNISFATVESLEGMGAVYRLLTWKDGYCKFFADEVPVQHNIQKNIESIFVEGIDVLAKFNKFMDEFPSLNAYVDVISVTGQEEISNKEATILKIVNQNETLHDVIKYSPYDDVETLELTAKLYGQRMIGLSKGLSGQQEVDYDKEAEELLKDLL
ncbi:hypothetical protein CSB45_10830 [candidate division KSB3 bacterium]|uniref:PatA-like N-terminal domain-containing protein n=1 Tax=candidate division KSB3 bacterium TaxID=2044937 RepID=A0A2G6E3G8_9BACT|nr:MAG: hypothetical protein CSB45_10830 [candidate division KSB3 bacterium]PIE29092.1 MAG: hypothetical protein CSA57_10775 [candidate division KSB3 bacterium]